MDRANRRESSWLMGLIMPEKINEKNLDSQQCLRKLSKVYINGRRTTMRLTLNIPQYHDELLINDIEIARERNRGRGRHAVGICRWPTFAGGGL
jgi:hypothetical protein